MAAIETDAMADGERRARVRLLLPEEESNLKLTPAVWTRAAELEALGFKPADAVHVAAAEHLAADVLLSCVNRLYHLAKRRAQQLRVRVANPVDWLKEVCNAPNA